MAEAVPLAHVLVDQIARANGIRALAIKGPVSRAYGLRVSAESVDADLIVEPSRTVELVGALNELGWSQRRVSTPSIIPRHAIQLRHARWPIELDLHHRFPGVLADPAKAFEQFWERRAEFEMAGASILAADLVVSTLLTGLHAQRSTRVAALEWSTFVQRSQELLNTDQKLEFAALARSTDSAWALASLINALVGSDEPEVTPSYDWWVQSRFGGAPVVPWVYTLSRTRRREWFRVLIQACWQPSDEVRQAQNSPDLGGIAMIRARILRLARAARAAPTAVRLLRRLRRQYTDQDSGLEQHLLKTKPD